MKFFSPYFAIILIAWLCLSCSKPNTNDGWTKFTSEEGGFSVSFPGLPKEQIKNTKPFPAHLFIYKVSETNSYVVIYTDIPSQPDSRGPEKVFDDSRDASLGPDGKLISEKPITLNGYSGREIQWETKYKNKNYGDAFAVAHFFVTKKHFYEVLDGVPINEEQSTNIWYFLNSFDLLDAK